MKQFSRTFFLSLAIACFLTCAQVSAGLRQVTASEYCNFLNHNVAADQDYFYDEHMSTDPNSACIVRVGVAGQWQYEVIAGRGNFPVTYVNKLAEEKYEAVIHPFIASDEQNSPASYNSFELLLKSNQSSFTADSSSSNETLSLGKSTSLKKSDSSFSQAWISRLLFLSLCVIMIKHNYGRVENPDMLESDSDDSDVDEQTTELTPLNQRVLQSSQISCSNQENSSFWGWVSYFSRCFEDSLVSKLKHDKKSAETLRDEYTQQITNAKQLGKEVIEVEYLQNTLYANDHELLATKDHIESLKDKKNSQEQTLLLERADQHEITRDYLFQKVEMIHSLLARKTEGGIDPVKDSALNLAIENSNKAIAIITRILTTAPSSGEENLLKLAVGEYKKSADWAINKSNCSRSKETERLHTILGDSIKYSNKAAATFVEAANAASDKKIYLANLLTEAAKKYQDLPELLGQKSTEAVGQKTEKAVENFDLVLQAAEDLMKAAEEKYKEYYPGKECSFSTPEGVEVLLEIPNDDED